MLDISVDRFSATVSDLFIHEADGIQIDDVGEISVHRVAIDGSLEENTLVDSISAGIVSTGDVHILVDSGDTIINQITSQGNITITNLAGSIVDHADDQLVDLTAGDEKIITLTIANNIEGKATDTFLEIADHSTIIAKSTSQGNIHIQGMGSLNLQKLETADGSIQVKTQNNIFIDYIEAIGNIDLTALSGSILETRDDATVNLKADQSITLTASKNIGNPDGKYLDVADLSTVAVSSTAQGDIFIRAEGELIINDASTANGRIDIVANDQIQALNMVSGGDQVRVHTLSGDILIGKILSDDQIVIIADQGTIMDSTNDDLVDLTSGNNKQIILNAFNHINGINNTFLDVADDSIINATTTKGAIRLQGEGKLRLHNMDATDGNIHTIAQNDIIAEHVVNGGSDMAINSIAGSIEVHVIQASDKLRLNAGQAIIDKAGLITANAAIIKAVEGIGSQSDYLTLDINDLDAANLSSNSIFINNTKALTLMDLDQDSRAMINDGNADIMVLTLEGDLSISNTIVGHSDILLSTQSENSSILLNGNIMTNLGNVSILSGKEFKQSASIISSGTVDIYASNGGIFMADDVQTHTQNANIKYQATGDIVIENINAGESDVGIYSESGSVYANLDTDHVNITAANTSIKSANVIGTSDNHLNTLTDTLAVKGSGHIFISDHSSVTIDQVDAVDIKRVQIDGSTLTVQEDSPLSGLVCNTAGANIVIQTLDGDLTINAFESSIGNGNIRLFSGSGNTTINDHIISDSGHMSILSENDITQNAQIETSGTIDIKASNNIVMNSGALTRSLENNVQYKTLQGNIIINEIDAQQGIVRIVADNGNISPLETTDSENVLSHGLIIQASGNVESLKTNVSVLTAMTEGHLIIENTGDIVIDQLSMSINRIESDGIAEMPESANYADLTASKNGSIVLNTSGSITANDGNNDNLSIEASSGNILLQSTDEISIQSKVDAGSGSISIIAASHITLGDTDNTQSHIQTSGNGTIDMQSKGNITIFDGNIVSAGANIRLFADEVLTIGEIKANGGSVSLTARDISDSDIKLPDETEDIDIIADNLMIQSDLGAGGENRLDISVDTLSADVKLSGLFIHEMDGLHIDDVGEIKVNRVGLDGHLSENEIGDTIEAGIRSQGVVNIIVNRGDFIQSAKIISDGIVNIDAKSNISVDYIESQEHIY
jgi:hypothetical protein